MKKILVSGVSRGLGLRICSTLLSEGYFVIGVGRNKPEGIRSERFRFYSADFRDLSSITSICNAVTSIEGDIYGLVNNSAIGGDGVLATLHQSDIQNTINVNLLAPIIFSKYIGRRMLAGRNGRIINISSIVSKTGYSGLSVYGATKSGLVGFTKSLSREYGKRNVTVNCIAPGFMKTDMTSGLSSDKLNSIANRAPLGLPNVEDVANVVTFLLSDASKKITGEVITVDGGATA